MTEEEKVEIVKKRLYEEVKKLEQPILYLREKGALQPMAETMYIQLKNSIEWDFDIKPFFNLGPGWESSKKKKD